MIYNRIDKLKKYAKLTAREQIRKRIVTSTDINEDDLIDNLLKKSNKQSKSEQELYKHLTEEDAMSEGKLSNSVGEIYDNIDELVVKLGYLDLREFIALNKYLLEASNHKDYINNAKAKFLTIAMQRLNKQKEKDISNQFKSIDEDVSIDKENKMNKKVDMLIGLGPELKEMFYKCYYKIKNINEKKANINKDDYEKYSLIEKALKEQEQENNSNNL